MNSIDILLIILIAVSLLLAIRTCIRNRRKNKCNGCCSKCNKCVK